MKKLLIIFILFFIPLITRQNRILIKENIPHLEKHSNTFQLNVGGKQVLLFSKEIGNSNVSNLNYINNICPRIWSNREVDKMKTWFSRENVLWKRDFSQFVFLE